MEGLSTMELIEHYSCLLSTCPFVFTKTMLFSFQVTICLLKSHAAYCAIWGDHVTPFWQMACILVSTTEQKTNPKPRDLMQQPSSLSSVMGIQAGLILLYNVSLGWLGGAGGSISKMASSLTYLVPQCSLASPDVLSSRTSLDDFGLLRTW